MTDLDMSVKMDPDEGSLSPIAEDERFEDTGELEMPKDLPEAWLVKVPKTVVENWSAIDDDNDQIPIAVMRYFPTSNKTVLLLNPQSKHNRNLPLEYDWRDAEAHGNTFVFSEKDLPNHDRKRQRTDQADEGPNKRQRGRPWRNKTVPKQTKMIAVASKEAQWFPVQNEQYQRAMRQRKIADEKKKSQMNILGMDATAVGAMMYPGAGVVPAKGKGGDGGFNNFIVCHVLLLQLCLITNVMSANCSTTSNESPEAERQSSPHGQERADPTADRSLQGV